jgi:hypothetical protein
MATKISELNALTAVTGDDLLVVVDEVANSSAIETKKVTVNNFFQSLGVTASNSVSASVSGNSLTISLNAPVINKYNVSDSRLTTQSNTAPYANTIATVESNTSTTANASTLNFEFNGIIQGSTSQNANGEPVITISSSETVVQNPLYNTVRVNKLNFVGTATPSNSSYVNSTFEVVQGDMFYDSDYIYVAVSNTEIKKITLSAF